TAKLKACSSSTQLAPRGSGSPSFAAHLSVGLDPISEYDDGSDTQSPPENDSRDFWFTRLTSNDTPHHPGRVRQQTSGPEIGRNGSSSEPLHRPSEDVQTWSS